jgi:hypothetical protein
MCVLQLQIFVITSHIKFNAQSLEKKLEKNNYHLQLVFSCKRHLLLKIA